jgi:crotonobetainyl-CoA:carnitine CoA-transferase CaiB-like acyl-CoA transferase
MAPVLDGLRVIDLSWGTAGAVANMLLADYGAEVIKVEPPGGDPFRTIPGYTVWNRGRKSVVLDLHDEAGSARLAELIAGADILVESFAPGTLTNLGFEIQSLLARHPRLIACSITGYGRKGASSTRPGYDALVQARSGLQYEQPGLRDGPIFLHLQLPSFGAALVAVAGISAALRAREVTGRGQWVETSLMQGALLWTTQIWKRATKPNEDLITLWKYRELGPTPCFEAGDGAWFHPMPQGVPIALAHVGREPDSLGAGMTAPDRETRAAYFQALAELYLERPRDEWVQLLQDNDVACQPVQPAEAALEHPQVLHNRAVTTIELPGVGPVTQVGHTYHLECHEEPVPEPPPGIGEHTDAVLASLAPSGSASPVPGRASVGRLAHALEGIRVLDFGTAVAGPFGAMILGDLGADVITIQPTARAGQTGESTWVSSARGKRCICVDLKAPEGRQIAHKLIASADVIHYNLRTGVAERLGFGYEQAKAINPRIVFCHLTGYGNTGPLAHWPGVDQMAQSLCGLEYEQGATPNGGHPTWYRFGMADATTSMLTVIGVLQALYQRERAGAGQAVETNILNAGMLLASDAFTGPDSLPRRHQLDRRQTGFGPYYRLYEAADGWLCVAAVSREQRRQLLLVTGVDPAGHADVDIEALLEERFHGAASSTWFDRLDSAGVPCEIARDRANNWYDDPDAIDNGWVVAYDHPVWGRFEQPGTFVHLSETPGRIRGAPPVIGADTQDVLEEIGYSDDEIDQLRAAGVVAWDLPLNT